MQNPTTTLRSFCETYWPDCVDASGHSHQAITCIASLPGHAVVMESFSHKAPLTLQRLDCDLLFECS